MLRSSTVMIYLLFSAFTVAKQINAVKAEPQLQKKWFEDGNGRFKWSFGCSFPKGSLFELEVTKIKKNSSSTFPSLCYEDNRCTHFVYLKGYCYLKSLKFVDASPTAAIYNNPGGLCGFLVERPNVIEEWNVESNGKIRWSQHCDYPNVKSIKYSASKFMLTNWSQCGAHCLSIKDCTHFAVRMSTCWVKGYRGAPVVQTVDKNVLLCGFIAGRQNAVTPLRNRATVSPKANSTNITVSPKVNGASFSFVLSHANQQQQKQVNSTFAPTKTAASSSAQTKSTAKAIRT